MGDNFNINSQIRNTKFFLVDTFFVSGITVTEREDSQKGWSMITNHIFNKYMIVLVLSKRNIYAGPSLTFKKKKKIIIHSELVFQVGKI